MHIIYVSQYLSFVTHISIMTNINTLRPRQHGRYVADDIFNCIFFNENIWILIQISLKFVPKGQFDNNPALVQIMAGRRLGDKPLSEPMMISLLTHKCVTRPERVNPVIRGTQNNLGVVSILRCRFTSIGIPMLKIRPRRDHIMFNMGIPYLKRRSVYNDGLWVSHGKSQVDSTVACRKFITLQWKLYQTTRVVPWDHFIECHGNSESTGVDVI